MLVRRALDPHALRRLYDRLAGRYDWQHAMITAGADGRGRRALVEATIRAGNFILDAGSGTGATGLLAIQRAGPQGRVVVLDQSPGMLEVADRRARTAGLRGQVSMVIGDIQAPPFRFAAFDVVLSTYSMCPLVAPTTGAEALYRLVRPGGRLGVAHSVEPRSRFSRWLGGRIEALAWRWPGLSMGCRAVEVLPHLQKLGAVVEVDRHIGVPLWPFHVFVVRKPIDEKSWFSGELRNRSTPGTFSPTSKTSGIVSPVAIARRLERWDLKGVPRSLNARAEFGGPRRFRGAFQRLGGCFPQIGGQGHSNWAPGASCGPSGWSLVVGRTRWGT